MCWCVLITTRYAFVDKNFKLQYSTLPTYIWIMDISAILKMYKTVDFLQNHDYYYFIQTYHIIEIIIRTVRNITYITDTSDK